MRQQAYLGWSAIRSLKVLGINLSQGEVLIQKRMTMWCINDTDVQSPSFKLMSPYLTVSNTNNKFTAIVCSTIAIIEGENQHNYTSGCVSFCQEDSIDDSGMECTGMGCCQTSIPRNLRSFTNSFLPPMGNGSSAAKNFSPCSYAFVAEQNWFNFSTSYANSKEFGQLYGTQFSGVPMVLDWVLGNETCVEAMTKQPSTYACLAEKSICVDTPNGLGYRCNCSPGYEGNPYIPQGCQGQNARTTF